MTFKIIHSTSGFLYCEEVLIERRHYTGRHKKKRELLINPTKIEEIQQKILLTEIEQLQLAF